jgi:hypothetical protein
MLEIPNGKLLVYASRFINREARMKSVNVATEKMGKLFRLDVERVKADENSALIYVYYKNGDEEPIPIYCNKGEESDMQDIYNALRNMIFVLSFHPRHAALKRIRREVMQFS